MMSSVPLYAIVELLIRLENYNQDIGTYKNHAIIDKNVRITTTTGHLMVPLSLVMNQFHSPEAIDEYELKLMALSYSSM